MLQPDFVVDRLQFPIKIWWQCLLFVELRLVGEFLAFVLRRIDTRDCCQNGKIYIGFGLLLGKVDILWRGVGVEQGLVASP